MEVYVIEVIYLVCSSSVTVCSFFSSARFEGSLNMDLNEISMNLVPFPRLHYLVSSLTPLYTLADVNVPSRRYEKILLEFQI